MSSHRVKTPSAEMVLPVNQGGNAESIAAGVKKHNQRGCSYEWLIALLVKNRENELAQKVSCCRALISREGRNADSGLWVCRAACCPACLQDKGFRMGRKYKAISKNVMSKYPDCQFLVATFKVKPCDCSGVGDAVGAVNAAFAAMVRRCRGGYSECHVREFQRNLLGYVRVVECALNPASLECSVHVHCLFAVKRAYCSGGWFIGRDKMKWVWRDCLVVTSGGEYLPNVPSNSLNDAVGAPLGVFNEMVHASLLNGSSVDSRANTAAIAADVGSYVSYALKGQWLVGLHEIAKRDSATAADCLKGILAALKGRNLVSSGGCFKPKRCWLESAE